MNGDPLDEVDEAWAEVARLQLTADERKAIKWIIGDDISADGVNIQATLRAFLERHDATGSE